MLDRALVEKESYVRSDMLIEEVPWTILVQGGVSDGSDHLGPRREVQCPIENGLNEGGSDHVGLRRRNVCPIRHGTCEVPWTILIHGEVSGGSDHLGPKRKDQGPIGPWLNEGSLDHLGPSRGALCPIAQDASPDRTRRLKECFGPFWSKEMLGRRWLGPPWSEEQSARSDRTLIEGVK